MAKLADTTPVIWAIGGVDCLGVAGIMADARAAMHCDVHCATIVSCVTAQNSHRFSKLSATSIELLEAQWLALIEQTVPQVIKIGLLANVEQVVWLAGKLASLSQHQSWVKIPTTRVIYDPVLASSSDGLEHDDQMLASIKQHLLPQVDLLTPNLIEAQRLGQLSIDDNNVASDFVALARTLSTEFELSVLVKGGHLARSDSPATDSPVVDSPVIDSPVIDSPVIDSAYDCYVAGINSVDPREPVRSFVMASPWLANDNIRGTGCTIASLIASQLAQDYTLCDALVLAKATINQAIDNAMPLGNHRGGLSQLTPAHQAKYLPQLIELNQFLAQQNATESAVAPVIAVAPFAPTEDQLGLYPVVNTVLWLERLLQLGVKTIQLRAKDFCVADIEPQIIAAIALGRKYQARLFINDYWQLAIKHQAYGVHLGQEDLAVADLEQIKAAGLRLGLSTHGLYEAIVADQLQPSYIALGHIYATQTKDMPSTPQGIDKLKLQVKLFELQRPLVAIGGITRERVADVVATGIGSVALVTAITLASDVTQVTESLLAQIGAGQPVTDSTTMTIVSESVTESVEVIDE